MKDMLNAKTRWREGVGAADHESDGGGFCPSKSPAIGVSTSQSLTAQATSESVLLPQHEQSDKARNHERDSDTTP